MLAGELWIEVRAKTQKYYAELNKMRDKTAAASARMQASIETYSRRARRALLVAGAAFVGMMKITADAEESIAKFYAVFKEESGRAEQWAKNFAKSVKRSVTDVMDMMAGFQDLFVPLGFARDKARELSQQMIALTYDTASFKNLAVSDAYRKFTSGLVGMSRAVLDLGIDIREATLKQELLRMGFDGVTKKATEQDKVLARVKLMYRMSADAIGDLERTSGSLTNRFRAMVDAIKETSIVLGQIFIPLTSKMVTKLKEWVDALKPLIEANAEMTLKIIAYSAATVILISILDELLLLLKGIKFLLLALVAHPIVAGIIALTAAFGYLVHQLLTGNRLRKESIRLQKEEAATLADLRQKVKSLSDAEKERMLFLLRRQLARITLRQKQLQSIAPPELITTGDTYGMGAGAFKKVGPAKFGALTPAERMGPELKRLLDEAKKIRAEIQAIVGQPLKKMEQVSTATPEAKKKAVGGTWMGIAEVWRGAVSAALKGRGGPEERTAKATSDTARYTKQSAEALIEIKNKPAGQAGMVFIE